MALDLDFDGDLEAATADLPTTITWAGADYAACVDPVDTAETADTIAGVFSMHMFNVTVRTVLFTGARPAVGDTVVIDSTTYRITRTSTDEADAAMELTVQELTA